MLQNVVVSTFNHQISLTTTFKTQMQVISESMTVTSSEHSLPKSNVVSLTTSILAINEFTCNYSCIECKKEINAGACKEVAAITCPTCGTIFLKSSVSVNNNCMVMLADRKWFQAHTSVSNFVFLSRNPILV